MPAAKGEGKPPAEDALGRARLAMVQRQLIPRGISEPGVLAAISTVPRHRFIERSSWEDAYGDFPLPIGYGQTISQPYMVARMSELCALGETSRVLEIGAGCGYQSAILGAIAQEVYSIELVPELARRAEQTLAQLGFSNIDLRCGDGTDGWVEHAPYDAIVVAAGAHRVPPALKRQLADGGRLVIPVGPRGVQQLKVITRRGERFEEQEDTACRFVELRGTCGWEY